MKLKGLQLCIDKIILVTQRPTPIFLRRLD